MPRNTPRWNYVGLLKELGVNAQIADLIRQEGFTPPPYKTLAGWRYRNAIPGRWAPFLIALAIKKGLFADIDALAVKTPRRKLREALERRQAVHKIDEVTIDDL